MVSRARGSRRRYGLMLSYVRRRWRGWVGILLVTLVGTGTALLAPLPLKVLVDSVLGSHAAPTLLAWGTPLSQASPRAPRP